MIIIIFNNSIGDVVRIGLYENGKWLKWIPKKQLDIYIEKAESVENKIL